MYRSPREVQRRRMAGEPREDRAVAVLLAACGIIFVAQWPRLAREAYVDPSIGLDGRMAGALVGWIFFAPLFFYGLALLAHWALGIFGRSSTPFRSRMALFWALLSTTPLFLLAGLTSGFVGQGAALSLVGLLASGAFLLFWWAGLAEISQSSKSVPREEETV